MTLLVVVAEHDADDVLLHTRNPAPIGDELCCRGVAYSQRSITPDVHASSPDTEILSRCGDLLAEANTDGRYKHIDVARQHPDELDAAVAAGWSGCGVTRPDEPNAPRPLHHWVRSLAEVEVNQQV